MSHVVSGGEHSRQKGRACAKTLWPELMEQPGGQVARRRRESHGR